jgi:hypothetical protein
MSDTNGSLMLTVDGQPEREKRKQNLSTKLTEAEARSIDNAALRAGKSPSDWAREVLLRGAAAEDRGDMDRYLFTELVGVQLLLMNAFEPLLLGEKLPRERVLAIFREVQNTKPGRARELLARRAREKEE